MRVWIDSKRNVEVDERLIPTGKLLEVERDGPLDFVKERELKEVVEDERSEGLCGKSKALSLLSFETRFNLTDVYLACLTGCRL